ncbi:MAG: DUF3267 domain-containing protein [Bacteroidetes bacterium]|nr:DUF3267 domain-containing protein [Fibrella sp.]
MKPTIDQLNTPDQYTLIESIRIDDMNTFVLREMGMGLPSEKTGRPKASVVAVLIVFFLGIVSGFGGYELAVSVKRGAAGGFAGASVQVLAGLVGFLVVLPIHEAIHGLVLRWAGAKKVGYGGSLKSLMVYAYAQSFVMTLRELAWVAVMPFLLITAALMIAWFIWPVYGLAWGTLLFLHSSGCLGDFALIRYYHKNRRRAMYTYDDVEGERRSYFFEAVSGV